MATEIDPRPVTSFDDLLKFTESELVELRRPHERTWWDRALAVLVWMPILMVIFAVVWLLCAAYWWSRYLDEVLMGISGLIALLGG